MLVNRIARDRLVRHLLVTDLLDTDKESKIAKGTNVWSAQKEYYTSCSFCAEKRNFLLYCVASCEFVSNVI